MKTCHMAYKTQFPVAFYRYTVSCTISGHVYGRGTGPTLAAAKQAAAKEAYEKVKKERSLRVCAIFSLITEV